MKAPTPTKGQPQEYYFLFARKSTLIAFKLPCCNLSLTENLSTTRQQENNKSNQKIQVRK